MCQYLLNTTDPLFEVRVTLEKKVGEEDESRRLKLYWVWTVFWTAFVWLSFIHWTQLWIQTFLYALALDLALILWLLHRYLSPPSATSPPLVPPKTQQSRHRW
jgi:hypothetical protein